MTLSQRINKFLHPRMEKRVWNAYQKKVERKFKERPDLAQPVDAEATAKHLELYGRLGMKCSDKWLRLYSNLTGYVDYTYLPEDVYYCCIERVLNECNRSGFEAEDKNILAIYVDKQYLPKTHLRFIRGIFYDADFNYVSYANANEILSQDHGPLVGKVAAESLEGNSVESYKYTDGKGYVSNKGHELTAEWISQHCFTYILQEYVDQCDFSKAFNEGSVNTCRMVTLRCPWNGEIVLTKASMKFGVSDVVADNMAQGGIAVGLSRTGELGAKAYSWKGMKSFDKHPTSGLVFAGMKHPYYDKMADVLVKMAARIPNFNLLAWDVVVDKDENVHILECNQTGLGQDINQFAFGSLFGDYTEPLIDWVAEHKQYNTFKHYRTWLF